MNYRYKKTDRLLKSTDFQAMKVGRKLYSSNHFKVVCIPRVKSAKKSRLGIIVTKRVGNSVERNLLKRLVREAFRTRTCKDEAPFGVVDFLVLFRSNEAGQEGFDRAKFKNRLDKIFCGSF